MSAPTGLVRLQADPAKVRVSIRRDGPYGWVVTVASRGRSGRKCEARDHDPAFALKFALDQASTAGIDGLDLDLQWTYYHPQGKRRAASRRPR